MVVSCPKHSGGGNSPDSCSRKNAHCYSRHEATNPELPIRLRPGQSLVPEALVPPHRPRQARQHDRCDWAGA
eukprot:6186080-Alexandrium_andersonii.AAC.1